MANSGTLNVIGSEISGNVARNGAGLINTAGTTTVTDSDLHDNTGLVTGGGVRVAGGSVTLVRTHVHDNVGTSGTGAFVNATPAVPASWCW